MVFKFNLIPSTKKISELLLRNGTNLKKKKKKSKMAFGNGWRVGMGDKGGWRAHGVVRAWWLCAWLRALWPLMLGLPISCPETGFSARILLSNLEANN